MKPRWSLGLVVALLLGCTSAGPPTATSDLAGPTTPIPATAAPTPGRTEAAARPTPSATAEPSAAEIGEADLTSCDGPPGDGTVTDIDLQPLLGTDGSITGHRLTVPVPEGRLVVDLAGEAFAGPSSGPLLVYGDDDGRRSRMRVVDVTRSCLAGVVDRAEIVRGATVDAAAAALYEHQLKRARRDDRGIFRSAMSALGDPLRVLPPIEADDRFGPTFVTSLTWGPDGELAVQSCGQSDCRTRILDPATGDVRLYDRLGQGRLLRVLRDALIVEEPGCDAPPCDRYSVDRRTGNLEPAPG